MKFNRNQYGDPMSINYGDMTPTQRRDHRMLHASFLERFQAERALNEMLRERMASWKTNRPK